MTGSHPARQALDQLTAYQNAGGKICAEQDCTVLTSGVTAGAFTTGSEVLITGSGGWKLKGIADAKDKEKLKAGAEAEIRLGTGKKRTVRIETIAAEQPAGGGTGESETSNSLQLCWYTRLPENTTAENGNSFIWTVNASSEQEYEQTIPLTALREDAAGALWLGVRCAAPGSDYLPTYWSDFGFFSRLFQEKLGQIQELAAHQEFSSWQHMFHHWQQTIMAEIFTGLLAVTVCLLRQHSFCKTDEFGKYT